MRTMQKLAVSVCAAAAFAAPAAMIGATVPTFGAPTIVMADPGPTGSGGPDGQGGGSGCSGGPGWHGCGGFHPGQGGFGSGCINGICGGWDGSRGWGG